jgi:DNA-binding beta-propeller fold protein YncE
MIRAMIVASLLAAASGVATAQVAAPPVLAWHATLPTAGEQPLRWPVGLAVPAPGTLVVADAYQPRLLVYREREGAFVFERAVPLNDPPFALAASGGRTYASLRGGGGLYALAPGGGLERVALPAGSRPGALAPAPAGGLLVQDAAGGEILELDANGGIVGRAPVDPGVRALAAGAGGGFYAVRPAPAQLVRHGRDGAVEAALPVPPVDTEPAWPAGLAVTASGELLVIDRRASRILLLDASGRLLGVGAREGWEPGLLRQPSALALLPDGRVVVADQGNGRVQVYRRVEPPQ